MVSMFVAVFSVFMMFVMWLVLWFEQYNTTTLVLAFIAADLLLAGDFSRDDAASHLSWLRTPGIQWTTVMVRLVVKL